MSHVYSSPYLQAAAASEHGYDIVDPHRVNWELGGEEGHRRFCESVAREFEGFGWKAGDVPDPQDPATFERSRLRWDELDASPHRELLEWHRRLIALRRALPGLRDGRRPDVRWDTGSRAFVVERTGVSVAVNLGREPARVVLGAETREILLSSPGGSTVTDDGWLEIPPMSVVITGLPGTRLTPASGLAYGDRT